MQRMLAVCDSGCAPSTRYRLLAYRDYFEKENVALEVVDWSRNSEAQSRIITRARAASIVVFQRVLPSPAVIRRIREATARLIYDFDDAVIYRESTRGRPRLRFGRWLSFRSMVRCCDLVTAGNPYLAGLASRSGPRTAVMVVPTTVDLELYDRQARIRTETPFVGWIGGSWTLPYLEALRLPLQGLCREDKLVVRVIADRAADLGFCPCEWVQWRRETEIRELKQLAVALAPLPDDQWTRGKCGLRLLQYLAAGVPAVASPVGIQAELIERGAAFPAESPEDWPRGIRLALSDSRAAAEIVDKGRIVVRQLFNTAEWAPRLLALWRGRKN